MQAGELGKGRLLWPVWDVFYRPQRTYLSFLNDLKPLIIIHVRFTHAQPQGCYSTRTWHGRSTLQVPQVLLPSLLHRPAPDHLPFAQRVPPPSRHPLCSPGHHRQQHPQSCIPWPRWFVHAYLCSLLDFVAWSHSFYGRPGGRCSISWPCLAWGNCALQCEFVLIQRISAHRLSYWWRLTEWPELGEPSASPWMRTWRSPRIEGDLQAPLDSQRHRPVSPSPTIAAPHWGASQCPRRWSACNKRL